MRAEKLASIVLRAGAAFAFLYPPINALSDPYAWIGYFPPFTRGYVPDEVLLHGFGIVEVVIALWILSGWRVFWPSLAATAMLLGIVVFNLPNFQVLFRDLTIAAMPFSLVVINYADERRRLGFSGRTQT